MKFPQGVYETQHSREWVAVTLRFQKCYNTNSIHKKSLNLSDVLKEILFDVVMKHVS